MEQTRLLAVIPRSLEATLRQANPWWRGEPLAQIPPVRRDAFAGVLRNLREGLSAATVLRGPRQIGKATILSQVVEDLQASGVEPRRILRVQFDDIGELRRMASPILEMSRWFSESILRQGFHDAARSGRPAYILLDEVQNLPDWAPQIKQLVDLNPVRLLVTGSSALRIEAGRDSLAGRITTFDLGPLKLGEIATIRGFGELRPMLGHDGLASLKDKETWRQLRDYGQEHSHVRNLSFEAFSNRGGYPIAQTRPEEPWELVAEFLNETVVQRAIRHDLRMGERGLKRDEHLLEEVFRLACRYAGQAPRQVLFADEIKRALDANIGSQRILHYLKFLNGSLLIRLIEPLELRLKKRRGPAKICLSDHALRAAWLQELVPLTPEGLTENLHLAGLAGHLAESTTGYYLSSIRGLELAHFPERGAEPEVDFVITVGEQRIPIEVKYRRRIDFGDTHGLRAFIEKAHYRAPFALLVTLDDETQVDDPRIVCLPLSTLLLLR